MISLEQPPTNFGAGKDIDFDIIPNSADQVRPISDPTRKASSLLFTPSVPEYIPSASERTKRFDLVVSTMHSAIGSLAAIKAYPAGALEKMSDYLENMYSPNLSDVGVLTVPENQQGVALFAIDARDTNYYRCGTSFLIPSPEQRVRIQAAYQRYSDAKVHAMYDDDLKLVEEMDCSNTDFWVEPLNRGLAQTGDTRLRFDIERHDRYRGKATGGLLRTWQSRLLVQMRMPKNPNAIPEILAHQLAHVEQLDQDPYCDFEGEQRRHTRASSVPQPFIKSLPELQEDHAANAEYHFHNALIQVDLGRYASAVAEEGVNSCNRGHLVLPSAPVSK